MDLSPPERVHAQLAGDGAGLEGKCNSRQMIKAPPNGPVRFAAQPSQRPITSDYEGSFRSTVVKTIRALKIFAPQSHDAVWWMRPLSSLSRLPCPPQRWLTAVLAAAVIARCRTGLGTSQWRTVHRSQPSTE